MGYVFSGGVSLPVLNLNLSLNLNPNSEVRSPNEIRNPKPDLEVGIAFWISFELRISDFGFGGTNEMRPIPTHRFA